MWGWQRSAGCCCPVSVPSALVSPLPVCHLQRVCAAVPASVLPAPTSCLQARDLAGFLLPMLSFDPSERASAAQALKHPWLDGPSQPRSSREGGSAAAADAGRSSRHSSRHGSDYGGRHQSQRGSRHGSQCERDAGGRKPSDSKRSSRPRSRSRTRSNSRGYEKRAR